MLYFTTEREVKGKTWGGKNGWMDR
jgi:hypothetical protein